ncbi:MAG: MerR family transcriptional regulator [Litoreibacter sp.]
MPAKAKNAFRTISEVAAWLGVPAHVLRFWESKFPQIKPVKRAGGRRYYRPEDMRLIGGIKVLLHEQGITIRGVQKRIKDEGISAISALSPDVNAPTANTLSKAKETAVSEPTSSSSKTNRDSDTKEETIDTNEDVSPPSARVVDTIDPIADVHDTDPAIASNTGSVTSSDHQTEHVQQQVEGAHQEPHLDAPREEQPEAFAVPSDTRGVEVADDTPVADAPIDPIAPTQTDMFAQSKQETADTQPLSSEVEPTATSDPLPATDDVAHEEPTPVSEIKIYRTTTIVDEQHLPETEEHSTTDMPVEAEESRTAPQGSAPTFEASPQQSEPQVANGPVTEEAVVAPILPPAPDLSSVSVPLSRLASLATMTNLRRCNASALGKASNLKEIETKARALRTSMADALRRASGA